MRKPVIGYEGYYEVSDTGSVWSVARDIVRSDGVKQHRSAKEKKIYINRDGYATVKLSRDGVDRRYFVHRLVYEAYIGHIPQGCEINHKDFNRLNNRPDNLEAISHSDNVKYTYDAGRHYTIRDDISGTNNPNYGNHVLSQKYADDPELSREKQGRPGLQNGRCIKITAHFPDGEEKTYGCIKHCAEDLINKGFSKSDANGVYQRIWKSMRDQIRYRGIWFNKV